MDEEGKDQGANVRQKAKDITNLLMDESRLRQERSSRANMRDRMNNGSGGFGDGDDDDDDAPRRSQSAPPVRSNKRPNKDDEDMKRAIEESKRTLAAENSLRVEEEDLQKALHLSQEAEAQRLKALEDANSRALFDDQNQLNPFPLVESSLQPQVTSIQPQFTSFNPYTQQMQQQQLQEEYLRQQQEWTFLQQQQEQQRQQQEEWQRQQILQQQQQQQQEEWLRQQQALQLQQQQQQQQWQQQQFLQQQQQQQPLQPQHTAFGSKNPFAFTQSLSASASPPPLPAFGGSSPVLGQTSSEPPSPTATNTRANARRPFVDDGKNAHLASLIANKDDGIDTFGNFGQLRMGHQHTGPAALISQRTGSNPFQQTMQRSQTMNKDNEQPFFSV